MPAWNDAEGGITFWAETEAEIRWAELGKRETKKVYKLQSKANYLLESILSISAYPLLWPLLFAPIPFEKGLELPEEDELEA